ncbi:MAG TPA: GNAT family N-acetyltransferase [Terriglobales bacterium]|nr:GNAT family N-acetyltransferase [Terriglobales bacterium]
MLRIFQTESASHIAEARELFLEYANSLGFSLCFQSFEQELAELPGKYAPPQGRLLLAQLDDRTAGCVGMRPLEPGLCEMKRLYVRRDFRGNGIGRALAEVLIAQAQAIGYGRMRLDTVESMMGPAVAMYRALGFYEIPPYTANPVEGATFMELDLQSYMVNR